MQVSHPGDNLAEAQASLNVCLREQDWVTRLGVSPSCIFGLQEVDARFIRGLQLQVKVMSCGPTVPVETLYPGPSMPKTKHCMFMDVTVYTKLWSRDPRRNLQNFSRLSSAKIFFPVLFQHRTCTQILGPGSHLQFQLVSSSLRCRSSAHACF